MPDHIPEDLSPDGRDIREFTDQLRPLHAVVKNTRGEYSLLRHADVVAAALDDETFSSGVSAFLQIPNGLDGDEHTLFREVLDPFLSAEAVAPFEDSFARIAAELAAELPSGVAVDAVSDVGAVFAVRAQSAWLGWSSDLERPLVEWVSANRDASRAGDRDQLAEVADHFDDLIRSVLVPRRSPTGDVVGDDVTAQLMATKIKGRSLTDEEIVSVLRNWTGGDLGSIALCVGVILHYLATNQALQDRLRSGVSDAELDAAIDEILRIDDPFLSNRRITTCPVQIAGVDIPARARVKLHWTSANRDEAVFGDPDVFAPDRNAPHNLVYGIGKHVCPGRVLATVELRIATRGLLAATKSIALFDEDSLNREVHPVGGWADVPIVLT